MYAHAAWVNPLSQQKQYIAYGARCAFRENRDQPPLVQLRTGDCLCIFIKKISQVQKLDKGNSYEADKRSHHTIMGVVPSITAPRYY